MGWRPQRFVRSDGSEALNLSVRGRIRRAPQAGQDGAVSVEVLEPRQVVGDQGVFVVELDAYLLELQDPRPYRCRKCGDPFPQLRQLDPPTAWPTSRSRAAPAEQRIGLTAQPRQGEG